MNTNEHLTEAARHGARGHTSAGASVFASLDVNKQEALLSHIAGNRTLTFEIIRTALNAMPRDEIEDLLNEMGETTNDAGKEQQLHHGERE